MFDKIRSYVDRKTFEIHIINNYININNFDEILTLTDSIITIKYNDNYHITIKGKDLSIKKLLDNEILISGKVEDIHFY